MTGGTVAGHTPGKWKVMPWTEKERQVVAVHHGKLSLICAGVMRDDAVLIAASKQMLAALVALVPADFDEHPGDFTEEWHAARAAIARATSKEASHG